jgi:hypothetical protein
VLPVLLLAGCPGGPDARPGGPAARQTVQQLGFVPLATAGQLGPAWAQPPTQRGLEQVVLDPDGKAALLLFAGPVDWPAAPPASTPPSTATPPAAPPPAEPPPAAGGPPPANAVWLSLAPAVQATPFHLAGHFVSADFAAQRVTVAMPLGDGATQYGIYQVGGREAVQPASAPDNLPPAAGPGLSVPDSGGPPARWSYTPPVNAASGTGRPDVAAQPGRVSLDPDGTGHALKSLDTGSLAFTALAGDAARQRAYLALDGAGVLQADLAPGASPALRWLIRDSGGTRFFLQPAAGKLVVATADGLSVIGLAALADLAPRLAAAQALTGAEAKRVRPAVKALGWDWTAVEFNPLGGQPGRLSLLDSSDPNSATAELDWSPATHRALRLLVTRQPRAEDEALRTADPAARLQQVRQLLATLGWPNAGEPAQQPEAAAGEVQLTCVLEPAAVAPRDPGQFRLWLTPDAAVWELRPATGPLPDGVPAPDAAKAQAVAAAQQKAGFAANPQTLPGGGNAGLYAAQPRFGWAKPSAPPFAPLAPEPFADATPCYEVQVLQTGPAPALYTVRLPAGGQPALAGPVPAGWDELRRARQGEFGPDAAAALEPPPPGAAGPAAGPAGG